MSDRKALILRGVAECVTDEELHTLLSSKDKPKAYVGFEPSGLLHAGSLVPMLKARELVESGFEVVILLACRWKQVIRGALRQSRIRQRLSRQGPCGPTYWRGNVLVVNCFG